MQGARAVVLDADALVAFQGAADELRRLAEGRALVLTPHPGEFRTLFPELAAERELDPWGAAAAAAQRSGAVILLKGVPTVVASIGRPSLTMASGNPGLATGGSGDVLSGIIGAALARELEPEIAAALGAQALGRGADLAVRRVSARSLRPMDVIAALPDLWREWDLLRGSPPPPHPPILLELTRPQTL
jgi:NAD(P)H-hydrate epimerase